MHACMHAIPDPPDHHSKCTCQSKLQLECIKDAPASCLGGQKGACCGAEQCGTASLLQKIGDFSKCSHAVGAPESCKVSGRGNSPAVRVEVPGGWQVYSTDCPGACESNPAQARSRQGHACRVCRCLLVCTVLCGDCFVISIGCSFGLGQKVSLKST